jgi:hypothetical protein
MSNTDIIELSGKQAAAFIGVSTVMFYRYLKGPYPPPQQGNKKYMSDSLGRWFKEKIIRDMTVVSGDGKEVLIPQQELARKNKELADKTALENQVRRGELIETAEVAAAGMDVLARVKARMLRIASAVAPLVLGEDDQIVIQETIEDMVRDALSEMSADWREEPITELPE